MGKIERFEDIHAWQRARELRKMIYSFTKRREFSTDFALRDQIRRAVTSITSNIAEGFERGGNKEFIQFLATAKGSCGEVRDQLYVALDEKYISEPEFQPAYQQTVEISRMISGFMTYLRDSDFRGSKFKQL